MGRAFWSHGNLGATSLGGTNDAENAAPVSACCCSELLGLRLAEHWEQVRWLGWAPCDPRVPRHVPGAPLDAKTLFFPRHPYRCAGPQRVWQWLLFFKHLFLPLYNFEGLAREIPLTPFV